MSADISLPGDAGLRAPHRPRRWLWIVVAAAALASAAGLVVVVGSTSPAPSGVPASAPHRTVQSATAAEGGALPSAAPALRVALFQARMAQSRASEPALARAFATYRPPAPVRIARRAPSSARVVRGGTPAACLAQAVYYEARGEPAEGQAAVAQVVLNRVRSGRHPADVCGVVFEGARRPGCQFSFACDPRLGGRRPEPGAWRRAQAVAADALSGPGRPELADAVNYHADYVRPRWAAQLERTVAIGRHIFYAATRPVARVLAGWSFAPPQPAPAPPAGSGA